MLNDFLRWFVNILRAIGSTIMIGILVVLDALEDFLRNMVKPVFYISIFNSIL